MLFSKLKVEFKNFFSVHKNYKYFKTIRKIAKAKKESRQPCKN